MLQAVLFDLMDVVIVDPYRDALAAGTGLELSQVRARRDPGCWPEFELGRIDEDEFARRFFPDAGDRLDLDAFNAARRNGYRFIPGMPDLLASLDGVVQRHLASNYPVWIDELRETFGLDRLFEGIWASCYLGARKPDPAFFTRLLKRAGLDASRCLFVDDRESNCRGAASVGLRTHVFTDAEALVGRLADEGVPVPRGRGRATISLSGDRRSTLRDSG